MCRWCHLPRLTPRYLFLRYVFSQTVLVVGLLYLGTGFLDAQSQDYINAQHSEQIAGLTRRIERIENRIDYALWGIAGVMFTQILNLRSNWKVGK